MSDDFADGSHRCFCDLQYQGADPTVTCGNCPRDYIDGAWEARREYLARHAREPQEVKADD